MDTKKLQQFAKILSDSNPPDDRLYHAAWVMFERIKLFSLFTKHHGFEEEKEWRVVYLRDRDYNLLVDPMLHYNIGSTGIEPKLKFKLEPTAGLTSETFSLEKNCLQNYFRSSNFKSPRI